MDDGIEALVGFVGAHSDTLEFLEFAEEVLDRMTAFAEFGVERQGRRASWILRDNDLGAAFVEIGNDGVAVEGLVGDQAAEVEAVDERTVTADDHDHLKGSLVDRSFTISA
jgi:hypothetical protein